MNQKRNAFMVLLVAVIFVLALMPLLTVQADYGTNWTGTFFPSPDLSGLGVSVSNIQGLNFNWGAGAPTINGVTVPITNCPSSSNCTDNFSARFTSTQYLTPGQYRFYVSSDDGVRLGINGVVVLDKFIQRELTTDTVPVTITSSPVNLVVEYVEYVDQAVLQVQWFRVSYSTPTPLPTVTPSTPIRNFIPGNVIPLTWNAISWAAGYEVQVATDKAFNHITWRDNTLSANTLNMSIYLSNRLYYWRVRAKVNTTKWGAWSAVGEFTVYGVDIGSNWTGRFFPSTDLSGTGVTIINIQGLNFNWGNGRPNANGADIPIVNCPSSPNCDDNFSARFTSMQDIAPGQYDFVVSSDDGVRLYINGAMVLDKFFGRVLTTDTVPVTITSSPVNLTVEYVEYIDQAILQVQWFHSS